MNQRLRDRHGTVVGPGVAPRLRGRALPRRATGNSSEASRPRRAPAWMRSFTCDMRRAKAKSTGRVVQPDFHADDHQHLDCLPALHVSAPALAGSRKSSTGFWIERASAWITVPAGRCPARLLIGVAPARAPPASWCSAGNQRRTRRVLRQSPPDHRRDPFGMRAAGHLRCPRKCPRQRAPTPAAIGGGERLHDIHRAQRQPVVPAFRAP